MAPAPQRVVIDWDWGAHGIWTIRSAEEFSAPVSAGGAWFSYERPASAEPPRRPWSDKLTADLLNALQEWNDLGGRLFHYAQPERDAEDSQQSEDEYRSRAQALAAWTQRELGREYEVLFVTASGAWQWVNPPEKRSAPS